MNSKYLIYSNTGLTSKQIGLTAEIVENLKQELEEVRIILCDNVLNNCYFNRPHNIIACASCQSRMRNLLDLAGVSSEELEYLKHYKTIEDIQFPKFSSTDELLNYNYDNINIGRGVASSIISYTRDFELSSDKYGTLIEMELKKSVNILYNFKELIKKHKPKGLYIFNGRFAEVFPVIELLQQKEIPFYTLESGAGNNYEFYKNALPHSIKNRENSIIKYWREDKSNAKEKVGEKWFIDRRKGSEEIDISFIKGQKKGAIPQNFDKSKINIVIFNSSEDELKAIHEWNNPLFNTQNEAIRTIVEKMSANKNVHFYLRVHPNLGNVKNKQVEEIFLMDYDNLTVIPPKDSIDTYKMIEVCDKTIVFGSTTGIESTFWGGISILLGKSFYMNLDVAYCPKDYEELEDLILKKDLEPKPKENTYLYGFYMGTYGKQTKHFQYNGLNQSTYKGKKIKTVYANTLLYLIRYLKNFKLWTKMYKAYYNEDFSLKAIKRYK